jgi:hypothetical protein
VESEMASEVPCCPAILLARIEDKVDLDFWALHFWAMKISSIVIAVHISEEDMLSALETDLEWEEY